MTIAGKTAQAAFEWDCAGIKDFDYPPYFIVGETDNITFYPTLNVICADGAITGHQMFFGTMEMEVEYWTYDYICDDYVEGPITTVIPVPCEGNAPVRYGITANDLITHTGTTEIQGGAYRNQQTVYDFYYYDEDDSVEYVILVLNYTFTIYDKDAFDE